MVVGAVFLVAVGTKAVDPAGFARQIDAYGWLPAGWSAAAAFALIATEMALAAALLLGAWPRPAAAATAALLALFVVASGEAWLAGRQIDCGCFGSLVERGPGEVVIEDLILLALLVPSFVVAAVPARGRWRGPVVVACCLLALGLAVAAPHLPLDDWVTDLAPGATVEKIGMDTLVPEQGAVVIALLDLKGDASRGAVAGLNDLAGGLPEAEVIGFAAAGPEERATFGWTAGAGFRVEEVGAATADALARRLPRFALLVDGRVAAVWNDTPPTAQAVRQVLGGAAS